MTAGIKFVGAGFSKSNDMPRHRLLATRPAADAASHADTVEQLTAERHELSSRVAQILDTSLADHPAMNTRPQRSLGMRLLLAIPGLGRAMTTKTARDLMREDPAYRQTRKKRVRKDVSIDPSQSTECLIALLDELYSCGRDYDHAWQALIDARAAVQDARRSVDGDALSDVPPVRAQVRPEDAVFANAYVTLIEATEQLRAKTSVCAMLDVSVQVLSADVVQQKIRFVEQQIAHLHARLDQKVDDLNNVVDVLDRTRERKWAKYALARTDAAEAERNCSAAEQALRECGAQLMAARGSDAENRARSSARRDAIREWTRMRSELVRALAAARVEATQKEQTRRDALIEYSYFDRISNDMTVQLANEAYRLEVESERLAETRDAVAEKLFEAQLRLAHDRDREKALSARITAAIAAVPPGFDSTELASEKGTDLSKKLVEVARLLPADDVQAERILPRVALMEMLCRGLSVATGGKPGPAIELLEALCSRPLNAWIKPARQSSLAEADGGAELQDPNGNLKKLFKTMAQVPRGTEVLNAVVTACARTGMEQSQLDAIQAYWMASVAQEQAVNEVRVWLKKAKDVASCMMRNTKEQTVFLSESMPPKSRAAFNAVKCGYLSNEEGSDYDLSNRNLLNITEMIAQLQDTRPPLWRWLPRHGHPAKLASPFNPTALRLTQRQMEAQGMETTKTRAQEGIIGALNVLAEQARSRLAQGQARAVDDSTQGVASVHAAAQAMESNEQTLFDATIVALSDFVEREQRKPTVISRLASRFHTPSFRHTKRIYDAHIGKTEITEIRRTVHYLLNPHVRRGPNKLVKLRRDMGDMNFAPLPLLGIRADRRLWAESEAFVSSMWQARATGTRAASETAKASRMQRLPSTIETLFEAGEPVSIVTLLKNIAAAPCEDMSTTAALVGTQSTDSTKQVARIAVEHASRLYADSFESDAKATIDAALADFRDDTETPAVIDEKIRLAKMTHFDSKNDVEAFFRPMLETMRLRDQLTLTGGGVLGGGIPILPAVPKFPMSASFGLHAKRFESFLQFKSPTFAAEIMMGSVVSTVRDAKFTAGYRVEAGVATATAPSGTIKVEAAWPETIYTTLRTLRGKDETGARNEQQAIDDNLKVLDILLRWDLKDAGDGERFADPLEAIFALSPETVVVSGKKTGSTAQVSLDIGAVGRVRTPGHHASFGVSLMPLSMKMERAREQGTERAGYPHRTLHDQSDQARQRGMVSATLGMIGTPFKHQLGGGGKHGKASGQAHINLTGNLLEFSRELVSNFEKVGATRFPIGDLTASSIDRSYGSPKDLLAEVQAHREDWLMRCLDALPREKDAPADTPQRQALARSVLKEFERTLRAAGANSSFQFNIKYEMQPRMSGLIDGLRGVEALARLGLDSDAAAQAREMMNVLLSYRVSWSVKNMAVRCKGKSSEDMGLDFFLRWQKTASSETSRAVAAIPT